MSTHQPSTRTTWPAAGFASSHSAGAPQDRQRPTANCPHGHYYCGTARGNEDKPLPPRRCGSGGAGADGAASRQPCFVMLCQGSKWAGCAPSCEKGLLASGSAHPDRATGQRDALAGKPGLYKWRRGKPFPVGTRGAP